MRNNTAFVYGYGFEIPEISNIVNFIMKHKDAFCNKETEKIYLQLEEFTGNDFGYDDDEVESLFSNYQCKVTGQYGLGAAISNIMSVETGINFSYFIGGVDCGASVLFTQTMPWYLNDIEKSLTLEKLDETMLPYVLELGLNNVDLDDIEIEYFD